MNLHADAVRELSLWSAPSPDQSGLREAYLAFLADHEDGLDRRCVPGHLTASALVLDASHERVLLTLHPKVGRWLQLGGHCEPGDGSLAEAALREATEESGIAGLRLSEGPVRLDRHLVRCRPEGFSEHLDVQYVAVAPAGAREVISSESLELAWFDLDALPGGTDDSVRSLLARALVVAGG